jgi:hypothetical protein
MRVLFFPGFLFPVWCLGLSGPTSAGSTTARNINHQETSVKGVIMMGTGYVSLANAVEV